MSICIYTSFNHVTAVVENQVGKSTEHAIQTELTQGFTCVKGLGYRVWGSESEHMYAYRYAIHMLMSYLYIYIYIHTHTRTV